MTIFAKEASWPSREQRTKAISAARLRSEIQDVEHNVGGAQIDVQANSSDLECVDFSRREVIFREGSPSDRVFEILDGGVILSKSVGQSQRQILEIVGPGAWIGMTLGSDYCYTAQCLTGVRLRCYDHEAMAISVEFQKHILQQLQAMLEALQEHTVLLARRSAIERIAAFLITLPLLCNRIGRTPSESLLKTSLKQRDIGDYLGLKVETVSRNLAVLKKRMIIATGKQGQFRLLNMEALQLLAANKTRMGKEVEGFY